MKEEKKIKMVRRISIVLLSFGFAIIAIAILNEVVKYFSHWLWTGWPILTEVDRFSVLTVIVMLSILLGILLRMFYWDLEWHKDFNRISEKYFERITEEFKGK